MGPPTFCRAQSDGQPVMTVALGTQQAVMPLEALQRQLGILEGSRDAKMLATVIEALNFVTEIRIGDALPSEVVTGQASWSPGPHHRGLATARLRMNLVSWLGRGEGMIGTNPDPRQLLAMVEDPGFRPRLQAAFVSAAEALSLPGPEQVLAVLARLAEELAYIEAMRERLLDRVQRMNDQISAVSRSGRGGWQRNEMLTSVQRLMNDALQSHKRHFEDIDRRTSRVVEAMRDLEEGRLGVRAWRDGMFASLRRWEELMLAWDASAGYSDAELGKLIDRTYRFLARRVMPGADWAGGSPQERQRQTQW
jgi:hypothetical protein